jgi:hypothetical protein
MLMLNMILQFKFIWNPKKLLGTFIVKVLLFGHMTQGFCFYYFLNKKFVWNKFKWKILDNLNYANFHGGGDFSYAYVIIINISVTTKSAENE